MKFNRDLAKQVRSMRASGLEIKTIAKVFRVDKTTIQKIVNNQVWFDESYKRPEKVPLDLPYIAELRKQGFTIAEIRIKEALHVNRTKPKGVESIRRALKQMEISA